MDRGSMGRKSTFQGTRGSYFAAKSLQGPDLPVLGKLGCEGDFLSATRVRTQRLGGDRRNGPCEGVRHTFSSDWQKYILTIMAALSQRYRSRVPSPRLLPVPRYAAPAPPRYSTKASCTDHLGTEYLLRHSSAVDIRAFKPPLLSPG